MKGFEHAYQQRDTGEDVVGECSDRAVAIVMVGSDLARPTQQRPALADRQLPTLGKIEEGAHGRPRHPFSDFGVRASIQRDRLGGGKDLFRDGHV